MKNTLELLSPVVRTRKEKSNGSNKSKTFIEFAPDPTIILNKSGCIITSNDSAPELFGYAKKDLREKDIESLIPGIRGKLEIGSKSFFRTPKMYRIGADSKLYAIQKTGNKLLVDISVSPVHIGNEVYSWAAVRKISEQKFNEDDPKITQAYARSLIEAALDPLVTISPEGKITDVNEASVKATGVPREKLIGTDFSDYFTEPQKAREGYQQVFAKGFVADYPLTLIDKKGKLTDVLYNASVYRDDLGNVLGVLAAARDITQVKRTSRYARSLIEAALDPLVTINPEGKITDVNEASVRATGVRREKLIGTDFSYYFTEPQKAREGYQQVFAKGLVADYPLTLRDKKGKLTDVLYNASVYKDDLGNVLGVLAAARDITRLKQTEEKFRKIQAYTRSLIETSLDPQITKGPDGRITDVNEATVQVTGVPREKLIGTHFPDYFTEPEKAEEAYQQAFYKGIVRNYPLAIRHVSGRITDVLYNATVFKDEEGVVQGVFASARDITDRKQVEEELKKQQAYTRSLIEASLDPMVAISPGGKITDVNEALVKATGVKREKLISTDFSDYFTEPDKAREGYQKVFAEGYVADLPLRIRHNKRDVLYNASVYRDEKGKVLGVFASARDITDRKQAEEEIKKQQVYTRSLIEASLDPMVAISPEGKITDVNEALVKATDVVREKLIGTDFSDYFTEPDKAREGYQKVFAEGYVADLPLRIRHNKRDVLYNASVYRDEKGKVLGAFASARDITDRKQVEEEIKKQQVYTRSLIEASLDPMVAISPEGKITDVNEALVKATDVVRERLIGTDFSDYFTEPEKAREGYQKVFAEGFVADLPLRIRHNKRDVLYNASVYRDEKGNVLGAFASARDITDRKQVEEEIKKQQVYTRSLIEASLDPMVAISPEGKITDVNEALVKATDVDREKLISTDFSDYFTEPEKAREGYQKVFAEGFVADLPLRIRHNKRDVLYNASVYRDEKGKVLGAFASARDITDRKQAEEEIKKQQVYTRSLIEASLDPMVAISPEGKITDVNEALVKATGVEREKLIGTDFSDYFTEPEKAREGYQQIFAKGFVADSPLTIRHNLRDVLYNASVYRDEKEKVLGAFASARDITAQRKQEVRIKSLNEELEQRIIELESFSYSVSHDLRAPLRGIDGFIAIFLTKYLEKVDGEGQRLLGNVRRNVNKMGSLIDELLTLSRIGMKDIQITTINMDELVHTVLEELSEMKGKSTVTVNPLDKARGDIALIKQVLVNLISNAFKYSNKAEKPLIEIGCSTRDGEMQYYIKDNGVGFDMEYSNKLFGVFQRLHDPQEYQGTGVGLAIVKRIIIRHGGRVWAEGKEGQGATFYFSLKPH